MNKKHDIVVVGAGIIGLSIAHQLRKSGRSVTLIDRKGMAEETSKGNAGAFAFAAIVPLAAPGIMRKAPMWLFDPLGPLSVPPAYALKILPWLMRFWRASWADRFAASLQAQHLLMQISQAALERQIVAVDGEKWMQREGQLDLFDGERAYKANLSNLARCREQGVEFEVLDNPAAIAEIQPGIAPRFSHACYTPKWLNTSNPAKWAQHIGDHFIGLGGSFIIENIQSLRPKKDGVVLHTEGGDIHAKQVVVACGAWSASLLQSMGECPVPLECERGYNTTLPEGAFALKTHLSFGGHGFVITKISNGVRVGGAVELGGLALAPNYKRAEALLTKATQFLPGLKTQGGTQWMGFRPSLPDSLPVIGPASVSPHVFYAFGHGHLGLTQSAGTAELVTALANETATAIPIDAYSPQRF